MKEGGCRKEFTVRPFYHVEWMPPLLQDCFRGIAMSLLVYEKVTRPKGCSKTNFLCNVQAWSKCVDAKRGDGHNFTEECREPTINLQHCMEEHRDYYQVPGLPASCSLPANYI